MAIKALIIDDEELARENLSMMIDSYCPEIEVVGKAQNKEDAKSKIELLKPDVLFLDICMPSGTEGLSLLDELEHKDFLVVFVTAFKEYALKAFNTNAVHYLLKPIDIEELIDAEKKNKSEIEVAHLSPREQNRIRRIHQKHSKEHSHQNFRQTNDFAQPWNQNCLY